MSANTKTIGIISVKGGVGKTSTVTNLGATMAHDFGKKVLLVDANYGAPNLGLHVGIVDPEFTLHDVFRKNIAMSHAIHPHTDSLHIVPGSLKPHKVNVFELKQKLAEVKDQYDMVMIDSSPNLNEEMLSTMVASDELLVVTTPDHPTLSCTMHAVKVAKQKGTPITGLIVNKVRGKKYELSIEDIEESCHVPVLAVIGDDVKMLESLALTQPLTDHKPKAAASIAYKKLAASLIGTSYADPRLLANLKGLFSNNITKDEVNRLALKHERQQSDQ